MLINFFNIRIYLFAMLVVFMSTSGCKKEVPVSGLNRLDSLVFDFHTLLKNSNYSQIYINSSDGLKEGVSHEDFFKIMDKISKALGRPLSTKRIGAELAQEKSNKNLVAAKFLTQYEKDSVIETFLVDFDSGEPELFYYHVESDVLIKYLTLD